DSSQLANPPNRSEDSQQALGRGYSSESTHGRRVSRLLLTAETSMVKLKSVAVVPAVCVLSLAFFPAGAHGEGRDLPELNRKVLKFAEDHKGEQVGNGECWTLAAEALSSAGAQRPGANGVPVYIFGRKLDSEEAILPGDVVQFEKAKFVHKS